MIDEIHVTNLALIGDASIEPSEGLTVLTGETGAGKSALLGAIKLLIGDRASADMVRDGEESLVVEGRFYGRGGTDDEGVRVVSRRVTSEGRSKCAIDGSMATVAQLAETIGSSVDLCGQHDHQRLLSTSSHLQFLDAWAGGAYADELDGYRRAWAAAADAARELRHVLDVRSEGAARVEDARFAIGRIEAVSPREGEYEELEASLPRLEHAGTLAEAADAAYRCLAAEGCALDEVNSAVETLRGAARYDDALSSVADSVVEAVFTLEDAATQLRRYRDTVDFDPEALQRADSRMGELVGLMRLFGPRMDDVFSTYGRAKELVELVDDSSRLEREARSRLEQAEALLADAARRLGDARMAAAPRFAGEVTEQMGRLDMGGAELVVDVERLPRDQWGANGADRVEFGYRPGAGMGTRPFARIASGGEVSRVMLAIKVALGAHDDVDTLVFDEIDAGVGGTTARAVGAVLKDLSATHQVIVVTHLAQIAAVAQRQYVVRKQTDESGRPQTRLEAVSG